MASQCSLTSTLDLEKKSPLSTPDDVESKSPEKLGTVRRIVILSFLCSAQLFDIFNAASTIIALPQLSDDLHFSGGALQWVVTAYTLTFAAFLLFAGRLADIYHPKPVFCIGYLMVGIFSVLCGVSVHPIMLLVFRAVQGIGAAFTFPSALAMIVQYFPEPAEKNRAFALFGAFGAIGNVLGFILGGVLAARANWRWIFYLVGIITTPFSILSFFGLPRQEVSISNQRRDLDWQGVVALAGGLILFVYAVSDGNDAGWRKPQIIVTLIFSVVFIIGFFIIERRVKDPAVPPKTWTTHNFLPLFFYCWSLYWFLNGVEVQLIQIFQEIWGWSALSAAVHCVPISITGGIVAYLSGMFAHMIPRRVLLIGGQLFMAAAVVLLAFADTPDTYRSHVLPAMIIGMIGIAVAYVGANIFIMASAPKGEEGVIGAMMNTAFQIGATVGLAVITAVTLSVSRDQPHIKGYQAGFWSILGMQGTIIIMSLFFVR